MLNRAYKYAIAYFLLFALLLFITATLIFAQKIGFNPTAVVHYYLGDQANFTPAKTYAGTLKIILPHIFAYGLFLMTLLHFLIFTKKRNFQSIQWLIYLSLISAFLELFSPFMILSGFDFFAYIKLFSFFLFEFLTLFVLFLLFKSILYE